MEAQSLAKFSSTLSRRLAFEPVRLISGPTPVESLPGLGELSPSTQLFIKREDGTDAIYGGNKVRNLEFLLGHALSKKANRLITVAPLGSNFIAALAAQAPKVGLDSHVYHFVPALTPQIHAHAAFSKKMGAALKIKRGGKFIGALHATTSLALEQIFRNGSYFLSPGGSSPIGVLGHVQAMLELAQQIENREVPEPDVLVVGVGTCGTLAGLIIGAKLAGLKTKILGVRCVDPIVCNTRRIVQLANSTLSLLGISIKITAADVHLNDIGDLKYGESLPNAKLLIKEVLFSSGITLDTTYTTKVFSFLKKELVSGRMAHQKVLYWHTFSSAPLGRPRELGPFEQEPTAHRPASPIVKILAESHAACTRFSNG